MKYSPRIYAAALRAELQENRRMRRAVLERFIGVLRKNGDLGKLPAIMKEWEILYYRTEGITKVDVTAARDLGKTFLEELHKAFGKNAALTITLRPEIIGGVIITINDHWLIDGSIRRRLEQMFK